MWPYADCLFFLAEELGIDVTSEPSSSPGQDGRETGATSVTNEVIAMFHSASCVFFYKLYYVRLKSTCKPRKRLGLFASLFASQLSFQLSTLSSLLLGS